MSRKDIRIFSLFVFLLTLCSCDNVKEHVTQKKSYDTQAIVINEVMAQNFTGIKAENDSLYDWIEIKNISDEAVNLHDYALATLKKNKEPKDSTDTLKTDKWRIPEMELAPGEILLVFASDRDCKDIDKELHADFKIARKNGCVQILSDDGDLLSEVKFDKLDSDQSYSRLDDGSYEKTFCTSPGFENTQEGYQQSCELIDQQRNSPLLIWEANAKGSKRGQHKWVEVKNVSDNPVNLSEYGITGEPYNTEAWQLPDMELAPGKTFAIDVKEKDVDIKSSKSIALTKDGQLVDGICCIQAPFGVSMGRVSGKKGFFFFPNPTRGSENLGVHYRFIAEAPSFNYKPGVYRKEKTLTLTLTQKDRTVHYTLDGSAPTASSPVFKDSVRIDTSTVIRAFCEGDTLSMRSNITTATYILNQKHDLPVINVSINSDDLYNPTTGIYMPGPNGGGEYPHKGANYWKKVTKKAHVEFYDIDANNSFSLDCGFAIFGGFSRTLAKKSFKLKFKDEYGEDRLDYDVFNEGKARKFKNLVLRSGSQDMSGVMVRDEFFTSLLKENSPNVLVQAYRPVALYINAQYFGLYYIREKIDKHFAAHYLNVPNDSINIIMSLIYNEEGPKTHFQSLINYVKTNDLSQKEPYEYMRNLVDFEGLIDEKLGQIYSGNTDVGNIRYIRSTDEKSDKKWHFVFYDVDLSWTTNKPAGFYLRAGAEGAVSMHNIIIDRLLYNKEFRQLFLSRLSMHLHKTFSEKNATKVFDNLINKIKPEMKLNCKRWPNLATFEKWEKNVDAFRKKFKGRDKYVLDGIRKELNVTADEEKKYFSDLGY